jgi:hypothetical protein
MLLQQMLPGLKLEQHGCEQHKSLVIMVRRSLGAVDRNVLLRMLQRPMVLGPFGAWHQRFCPPCSSERCCMQRVVAGRMHFPRRSSKV